MQSWEGKDGVWIQRGKWEVSPLLPGFRLEGVVDGMSCSQVLSSFLPLAWLIFHGRTYLPSPWTLEFASILLYLMGCQQKMLQTQVVRVALCTVLPTYIPTLQKYAQDNH